VTETETGRERGVMKPVTTPDPASVGTMGAATAVVVEVHRQTTGMMTRRMRTRTRTRTRTMTTRRRVVALPRRLYRR
jgi:hypothetical protein